jgi:hypothetical protein
MPGFSINSTGGYAGGLAPDGQSEAKRKYRWLFFFTGEADAGNMPTTLLYLEKASRPSWQTEPIDQHHNQEKIAHIGKTSWEDIELTWYDMETPVDCSYEIYKWMGNAINNIPGVIPQVPTRYKRTTSLSLLNNVGTPVENWDIYNSWPFKVNTGDLDYTANDLVRWTCTLKYDRAHKTR